MNKIEAEVRAAGKILLSAHAEKHEIHAKAGPANFLTDYDVRIQQYLINQFSQILPGCSFFGEEDTEGNKRSIEGQVFFIDPIDGTTNFMFDYRNSCVSVGLAEDGEVIAGWVYNPYTDQFWSAEKGKGAVPRRHCADRNLRLLSDRRRPSIVRPGPVDPHQR